MTTQLHLARNEGSRRPFIFKGLVRLIGPDWIAGTAGANSPAATFAASHSMPVGAEDWADHAFCVMRMLPKTFS
jgi:hypothetical protein